MFILLIYFKNTLENVRSVLLFQQKRLIPHLTSIKKKALKKKQLVIYVV